MKIVVDHVRGSRRGERQQFDSAPRLSIGRHPENDVSFDAHRDLDASSRHAELRREGRGFVLYDVGSSNGTFVDGNAVSEVKVAPGDPVLVEFGEGGPVLQIWVGKDDDEPAAPPAGLRPHTPSQMWRAALDDAAAAKGAAKLLAFARTLTVEVAYRSSWRFRLLLLAATATLVALLAAILLSRADSRDRSEGSVKELEQESARVARDVQIRKSQEVVEVPLGASRAEPEAEFSLVSFVVDADGGVDDGEWFCSAFAVTPHHLGTASSCAAEIEARRSDGLRVVAVSPDHGQLAIAEIFRHASTQAALLEIDGELSDRCDLIADPEVVGVGSTLRVFLRGEDGESAVEMAPAVEMDDRAREMGFDTETPPAYRGAPVYGADAMVVGINLARSPRNYAVRVDALRELMRENTRAADAEDADDSEE